MKKICVITDNEHLYEEFQKIIVNPVYGAYQFDFYYSERNKGFFEKYFGLVSPEVSKEPDKVTYLYDTEPTLSMVAEEPVHYGKDV